MSTDGVHDRDTDQDVPARELGNAEMSSKLMVRDLQIGAQSTVCGMRVKLYAHWDTSTQGGTGRRR